MSQSSDLYQELILHYSRSPRHFGLLDPCTHKIKADNPLCGDNYELFFDVDEQGVILHASFQGAGCAISKASTSLMLDSVIGKPIKDAETLIRKFLQMIKEPHSPVSEDADMGRLAAFSGVWKYPSRVKCAVLSWHAMHEALCKKGTETEDSHA